MMHDVTCFILAWWPCLATWPYRRGSQGQAGRFVLRTEARRYTPFSSASDTTRTRNRHCRRVRSGRRVCGTLIAIFGDLGRQQRGV